MRLHLLMTGTAKIYFKRVKIQEEVENNLQQCLSDLFYKTQKHGAFLTVIIDGHIAAILPVIQARNLGLLLAWVSCSLCVQPPPSPATNTSKHLSR